MRMKQSRSAVVAKWWKQCWRLFAQSKTSESNSKQLQMSGHTIKSLFNNVHPKNCKNAAKLSSNARFRVSAEFYQRQKCDRVVECTGNEEMEKHAMKQEIEQWQQIMQWNALDSLYSRRRDCLNCGYNKKQTIDVGPANKENTEFRSQRQFWKHNYLANCDKAFEINFWIRGPPDLVIFKSFLFFIFTRNYVYLCNENSNCVLSCGFILSCL